MTQTTGENGRIASLDGVRALAIAAVMAIHTALPFTGGGSIGVDIFFVLSGYLITGLLAAEFERARSIRFRGFYKRRALRLMPALVVMVLAGLLLSFITNAPELPHRQTGIGAILALTYTTNPAAAFWGYVHNPLLHTWSLGVEEYYYLLWPPLLYWGLRRGWSRLTFARLLLIPLAAASAYRILWWFTLGGAEHIRYGFDMRSDQLLIGSMLGLAVPAASAALQRHRRPLAIGAWVAVLFLVATVTFAPSITYSATVGYLLSATATAVVLLHLAGEVHSPLARILSWRPIAYIGRISYSLYLWGFIVGKAFPQHFGGLPDKAVSLAQYVALLLVAAASYHLIEMPIQRWGRRRDDRAAKVSAQDALLPEGA